MCSTFEFIVVFHFVICQCEYLLLITIACNLKMHVFSVQLSAAYVFIKLDTITVSSIDFEAQRVYSQDLPAFLRAGCGLTAPTFTKHTLTLF